MAKVGDEKKVEMGAGKNDDAPTVAAVAMSGLQPTVAYCDALEAVTPSIAGAVNHAGVANASVMSAEIPIEVVEPHVEVTPPHIAPVEPPPIPAVKAALPEDVDPEALQRALGEFRLIRKLGQGAMGTVFLAEHPVIGSKVAIKFLKRSFSSNPQVVEQFRDEARAVNRIGHPGILKTFDFRVVPPSCYLLVMEYVDGRSLSSITGAPVPPRLAIPILAQICDALDAAHKVGVVHRDVKPENVFLVRGERRQTVKLLDFGAARLQATGDSAHRKLVLGTPAYMPPEQWRGESIDGRTDVYAVGVIAYLLATGKQPFASKGRELKALFKAHKDEAPIDPRVLNPEIPDAWAEAILKALAKRREDRFQTAGELASAFRKVLGRKTERQRRAKKLLAAAEASLTPTYVMNWQDVAKPQDDEQTQSGFVIDAGLWFQEFRSCASTSLVGITTATSETNAA